MSDEENSNDGEGTKELKRNIPPTKESFGNLVTRLAARMRVHQGAYKTFGELKATVQNERAYVEQQPILSSLTQEIVSPNEDIQLFIGELTEALRKKFLQLPGLSMIVTGSNVHGGADIRKITNTEGYPDLDYALSADNIVSLNASKNDILRFVKHFIHARRKDFHLPDTFDTHVIPITVETVKNLNDYKDAGNEILLQIQRD